MFPTQPQSLAIFFPLYSNRNRLVESRHGSHELQVTGQIDETPSHEQRRFVDLFATHVQSLQIFDPSVLNVRKRFGESEHGEVDVEEEDGAGVVTVEEVGAGVVTVEGVGGGVVNVE